MTLAAISGLGDCAYGADANGNCLLGPPTLDDAMNLLPVDTSTPPALTQEVLQGQLASGTVPPASSSPMTALYLIGGAVLVALLLK